MHVIDDRTIAIAERPGNRRADGYQNILANPHVGLLFLIPGRGDTLRINGQARLVREAPFFDEMVVKGHRPLLAVVVDIEQVFFHCAKAFMRSGLWKPETWDPEAVVPKRADIAKAVEGDPRSDEELEEYYKPENYSKGLYRVLPLPQGPRHGKRLRAAARPRPAMHGDLEPRAGGRAVRPPGRDRQQRGAAGHPRGRRLPAGSWTTATPTARSRRCAATGSGCSRCTSLTRGSRPPAGPDRHP